MRYCDRPVRRGKTVQAVNYAPCYEDVWRNAGTALHVLNSTINTGQWSPRSRSRNLQTESHSYPMNGMMLGLKGRFGSGKKKNVSSVRNRTWSSKLYPSLYRRNLHVLLLSVNLPPPPPQFPE